MTVAIARPNRVLPTGEIVAIPLRGRWMGNRGILHDDEGRLVRRHASSAWITCALSFRGWRAPQWQPHHYTVLFFHDEAVALAAGHRPCALCRRPAYDAYRRALAGQGDRELLRAKDLDARLHTERLVSRTREKRVHRVPWQVVPSGAFALVEGAATLVRGDALVAWSTSGYGARRSPPRRGMATVLTPPTTLAALRGGHQPHVDPAAGG